MVSSLAIVLPLVIVFALLLVLDLDDDEDDENEYEVDGDQEGRVAQGPRRRLADTDFLDLPLGWEGARGNPSILDPIDQGSRASAIRPIRVL